MVVSRVLCVLALTPVFSIPQAAHRSAPAPAKPATPAKPAAAAGPVQRWMQGMTLRDRVAQLVMMPVFGENPRSGSADFKRFRKWVVDLRIGGLIVINRVVRGAVQNADPYEMAVFLNRMQRLARTPLLVGGDFERGASMRVSDAVKFPHNMAYAAGGSYEASKFEGLHAAREARALGVHWVFAPDADVNNNPDNPIINIRSYGEDPRDVARHVEAYIEGAHSDPKARVLVTAKHFPGHGDTAVDTHLGLAKLDAPVDRLRTIEWVPFRAAIEKGVDAVMTAHIALPAVDPREIPATLSAPVLTGVLRDRLGFGGIVVTDAMDMQGLARQFPPGEASVRALEAGVDVLLMPADAEAAIQAVVAAVKSGRLTRQRIDESVRKVLAAKARLGLGAQRLVNVEAITEVLHSPEAEAMAQETADRAVTLVRNQGAPVPLRPSDKPCLFVLVDSRLSQQGRQLIQEVAARKPGAEVRTLDAAAAEIELQEALQLASGCDVSLLAAFVSAGAYRGNVALPGPLADFVNALLSGKPPAVLMAFGNPYLLRAFPAVAAYMAMFSTVPLSETAAAKALFGEIPIRGRLPVTIPGLAKIGDGIQVEPCGADCQTARRLPAGPPGSSRAR